MELRVIDREDISQVQLSGRLDPHGTTNVEERLRRETAQRDRPAIVDLSAVTFITSLGIGVLVDCAQIVRRNGHKFVLVGPTGHVREVLHKVGVATVVPIVSSIADALEIALESA